MDQNYRPTQFFSVSQKQPRQIHYPSMVNKSIFSTLIIHSSKLTIQMFQQTVYPHSIGHNSINMNLSRDSSTKVSFNKINPRNELSNLEQSSGYELVCDQHQYSFI